MDNIILYSTGCPKCNILIKKLQSKHIDYKIVNDTQIMLKKNIDTVPQLEINGKLLNFSEANIWVNQQEV